MSATVAAPRSRRTSAIKASGSRETLIKIVELVGVHGVCSVHVPAATCWLRRRTVLPGIDRVTAPGEVSPEPLPGVVVGVSASECRRGDSDIIILMIAVAGTCRDDVQRSLVKSL